MADSIENIFKDMQDNPELDSEMVRILFNDYKKFILQEIKDDVASKILFLIESRYAKDKTDRG
ncbi:MAG: hypothetical protein WC349_03840 [Patescibacteria group bacterium]|jgi:hypothetical protein